MILEKIAAAAKNRVAARMAEKPLEAIREEALALGRVQPFAFERALSNNGISFICEVKKASPSKGVIAANFSYAEIARDYERAGAAAISVLTEPEFFLGADAYLTEIKAAVKIPVLRKDFTVDAYQIYEAKCIGADAVLLICALLTTETLSRYIAIADRLGLSCLVEAHSAEEVRSALSAGARIVGVNNRNLKDFTVDMQNSVRLRDLVPEDVVFVSESGIQTPEDIEILKRHRVHAALIGETFMRSADKAAELAKLRGENRPVQIKICGLTRAEDIEAVNRLRPDCVGFVFAASRRRVTPAEAKALKAALHPEIRAVGVFVDEAPEAIAALCGASIIDVVQLHGNETEADIVRIKEIARKPVVKAVRVQTAADIRRWEDSAADFLLLDTYSPDRFGGTGEVFDWGTIGAVKKPFFLAGGICAANAACAARTVRPYALDVSSGVETDGVKDAAKIAELIRIVRSAL